MRGSLEGVASLTKTNLGGVLAREKITGWKQKRISSCVWRGAEGHAGPPPPFPLSLSVLVFYARFSLATLFSRNPRKLTREYFKVFKGSAREGGARLAAGGQKKPTRRWSWRGGVGKKEIRAVCHFIRDTFHPSSFFSSLVHLSFFLSFFLYRNHEFRRRRH